ncbi:MAG: hypothetical protein A3J76_03535 [Candidatus Moranbacteria bacterium RBG_13_45_13]|nr:MAG: hypothetical protein A3J76_03535 [Candidatus Moranbacteria bacterium RBG_13_45_13]
MKFTDSVILQNKSRVLFTAGFLAVLICSGLVFGFCAPWAKADPSAKVQFTADTIASLSGISDGDLYIAQNSECDSLTVSGSTLTVSNIPDGLNFILKTPQHDSTLKISPSGGSIGLTFSSSDFAASTGTVSQWTLDGSGSTQVAHTIGVPKANTWYEIKIGGALFDSFESSASGEVSFTYNGGFSSKVFSLAEEGDDIIVLKKNKTHRLDSGVTLTLKKNKITLQEKKADLARGIVQIYQDDNLKENRRINRRGRWRADIKEKSRSALHSYYFRYLNSEGQEISISDIYDVLTDVVKPVFISLPKRVNASPGDTIEWQASDNDRVSYYKITFRGKKSISSQNSFALPASIPKGKSKLTVRVYDRAGNMAVRRARIRAR